MPHFELKVKYYRSCRIPKPLHCLQLDSLILFASSLSSRIQNMAPPTIPSSLMLVTALLKNPAIQDLVRFTKIAEWLQPILSSNRPLRLTLGTIAFRPWSNMAHRKISAGQTIIVSLSTLFYGRRLTSWTTILSRLKLKHSLVQFPCFLCPLTEEEGADTCCLCSSSRPLQYKLRLGRQTSAKYKSE